LPGVMPNNNAFGDWIKNLVAGVAPFVVAIFMIFMALALTGGPETNQPGVGYRPSGATGGEERVEGLRLPLIMAGNIDSSAFMGIIAMGFMLLLPEAVGITKKLVGAKGGIFDEYKDKAVNAFKEGVSGGQIIPGIAATKVPGAAQIGFSTAARRRRESRLKWDERNPLNRFRDAGVVGGAYYTVADEVTRRRSIARRREEIANPSVVDPAKEQTIAPPTKTNNTMPQPAGTPVTPNVPTTPGPIPNPGRTGGRARRP
jgi:hypothetical protein